MRWPQRIVGAGVLQSLLLLVLLGRAATTAAAAAAPVLRINEFLASNQNGLVDFEGDAEDWIELYNDGDVPVDLSNYALTDDAAVWDKWTFPSSAGGTGGVGATTILPAKSYLIVFASSQDSGVVNTGDEFHTNFNLRTAGEYLGLSNAAGTVLSEFRPTFPVQTGDVSYGYNVAGDALVFFAVPTPGGPNVVGPQPVRPVQFSVPRGFYSVPFSLVLTTSTTSSSLQIRYTLDGSAPTSTTGTVYTAPINIATTAIVRASSFGSNALPETNIPTHTYIFLGKWAYSSSVRKKKNRSELSAPLSAVYLRPVIFFCTKLITLHVIHVYKPLCCNSRPSFRALPITVVPPIPSSIPSFPYRSTSPWIRPLFPPIAMR
jgi:Lamin Tail Domain/Chitobiase/beta-hexosaminidase C-terminal domain